MAMVTSLAGQIITVLCVAALLEQLIPTGGTTIKYVRVFTGLFILVSILNPLTLSFNIWEQSLLHLDSSFLEISQPIPEITDTKLQQSIQLPQNLLIGLPIKPGTNVLGAELILENQELQVINIQIENITDLSEQNIDENWTTEEQNKLQTALSQILGIKVSTDQINLINKNN